MPLRIRSARVDDEASVVELWRGCGLMTNYNDPSEDFHTARARSCSDVLVSEEQNGRIIGSVMVGHDGHRGWLYYVAIDRGSRGHGHGREMIEAGEAWMRERGILKVQLLVREINKGIVDFYEKLGFEVTPWTVMAKWLNT